MGLGLGLDGQLGAWQRCGGPRAGECGARAGERRGESGARARQRPRQLGRRREVWISSPLEIVAPRPGQERGRGGHVERAGQRRGARGEGRRAWLGLGVGGWGLGLRLGVGWGWGRG